jgi:hypothetical protein
VENLYETKQGAQALLSPKSRINDSYTEFQRTAMEQVQFIWAAKESIANFKGSVSVTINHDQISFTLNNHDLLKTSESFINGIHTFTVEEAYKAEEFSHLNFSFTGQQSALQINMKDSAPTEGLFKDVYHLALQECRPYVGYVLSIDRDVPTSIINRVPNITNIAITHFPLSNQPNPFGNNSNMKFKISLIRTLVNGTVYEASKTYGDNNQCTGDSAF